MVIVNFNVFWRFTSAFKTIIYVCFLCSLCLTTVMTLKSEEPRCGDFYEYIRYDDQRVVLATLAAGRYLMSPEIVTVGSHREVTATSGDIVAGRQQGGAATGGVAWRRDVGPRVHRAMMMRRWCGWRRRQKTAARSGWRTNRDVS